MGMLIFVSAVVFVLSVAATGHAWRMSPIAESGQVASIILLGGLFGISVSFCLFIFLLGMLFAGAQP